MRQDAIGVFDSGVGGLSIWREIRRLLPRENTVYVADQKHLPYGEKSDEEIRGRSEKITKYLLDQGCSLIVIACNSATVSALAQLRRQFSIPFVGVEPAVKPAARKSKTGEITVLATTKTATSKRQRSLLEQHANSVKVNLLAAPEFVELVEKGEIDTPRASRRIAAFLRSHNLGKSDVFVLGCTHYIFLKDTIRNALPDHVTIIEPSRAIAKRVESIRKNQARKTQQKPGKQRFMTTANVVRFTNVAQKLIGGAIESAGKLEV